MSALARVRARVARFQEQIARANLSTAATVAHLAQTALEKVRLDDHFTVRVSKVYQLREPPKVARGFRDLVVRRATCEDLEALCAVDQTPAALVESRLQRGDAAYVGELDRTMLAHVWLHTGATFTEDAGHLARWRLESGTVWSFNAAASPDARKSGIFVKVFQAALRDAFERDGVARVQCLIRSTHVASIALHEKLGFKSLGRVLTMTTPLLRVARWEGADGCTQTSATVDGSSPELGFGR
jgi:ribosomal protein S18 acetylase RimI-like enzyme